MKIGIDWDGTINADPTTFREVICSFQDAGHDVAVVTWRCQPEVDGAWSDIEEIFDDWGFRIPVYYCNGRAKREYFAADIWIDDNPSAVNFSLTRPPRFEVNPLAYLEDVMVCEKEGFEPVEVKWGQLRAT